MESCKAMKTEGQISNQIEWLVIKMLDQRGRGIGRSCCGLLVATPVTSAVRFVRYQPSMPF